ncbi:MAG: BlaI/MecI/CopY family transcriptional regulator [Pirellulales bacterium]
MSKFNSPTQRELEILKILWDRGESTVRQVYEAMRQRTRLAQNTVQAFLRTMEQKGLVKHRREGRTFIYQAVPRRESTSRRMTARVLDRVFDGAIDQMVDSLLSLRQPSDEELDRLEELLEQARRRKRSE